MITLQGNSLNFSFEEHHEAAKLQVTFYRTLRVPLDGRSYPLPAGLGKFPLIPVEDLKGKAEVPSEWYETGGVLLPMYPSEAMWIGLEGTFITGQSTYPIAVKIAAGKINVITGEPLSEGPPRQPQDYGVVPAQRWIDGFCTRPGEVRQFVASTKGHGMSVEEQIWGSCDTAGIQILAYPFLRKAFESRFPLRESLSDPDIRWATAPQTEGLEMSLSPGGRIQQTLHKDKFELKEWFGHPAGKCFVRLVSYNHWLALTGCSPPHPPVTARQYKDAGIPWFSEYEGGEGLPGSGFIGAMKTVFGSKLPPSYKVDGVTESRPLVQLKGPKGISEWNV